MWNSPTWRLIIVCVLGFASGLPVALTSSAMQTWLTIDGIDIATIGFLSLVGLPYTFKFLWAPLMDRFEPPWFGRRKGWLFITQLSLAVILAMMSKMKPTEAIEPFALMAVLISFLSASQDIMVDAYRTDVLLAPERGLGSSLYVFGYRIAMILSGGIALVWADPINGNNWSWPYIYMIMAAIMGIASIVTLVCVPPVSPENKAPTSNAKNDLLGFFALALAVAIGYQITSRVVAPLSEKVLEPFFTADGQTDSISLKKWADLLSLLMGIAITLPLAWFASQKAKFETLNLSLKNYFSMEGAVGFLAFIILYKLGDAFAASLTTPFLLKGVGFAQAEIGVVNKVIGIWLTIVGALMGGTIMMRLGLYRSLLWFGGLQMVSNFGFWLVSVSGKGAWGSFTLPAFDAVIVSLKESTNVDWLLLSAVGVENLTGGMGTAAFVAFIMALCNQKFTATQYALLSAFSMVGRVWVGPLAGVLSESIGWPAFFVLSTVMAIPGLIMLWFLRANVRSLENPQIQS